MKTVTIADLALESEREEQPPAAGQCAASAPFANITLVPDARVPPGECILGSVGPDGVQHIRCAFRPADMIEQEPGGDGDE